MGVKVARKQIDGFSHGLLFNWNPWVWTAQCISENKQVVIITSQSKAFFSQGPLQAARDETTREWSTLSLPGPPGVTFR